VRVHGRLIGILPPALLVLGAAWWIFVAAASRVGIPSFDLYTSSYPNIVYELRSLRAGHGFFWNPLQNCGQPFPAATAVSAFYPLYLVFLVLDVDRGLVVIAFLHLALAGIGTYMLCREIGLGLPASLCGAIAFELSSHLRELATWHPVVVLGSFVWLPWALLWCERALRTPNLRAGLWLAVVLTLSLLAAFPQNTVFIYQVLLLRILWEAVTAGGRTVLQRSGALALGLLLPPALGAVQLLPAAEFAARSVRGKELQLAEIAPFGSLLDWAGFREALAARTYNRWPASIVSAALAPLAFGTRALRRQALFYALVLMLFVALAIDGPILRLYLSLPLGRTFRMPSRFLWVAGFSACMLAAQGVETLVRTHAAWRPRLPLLVLLGAGTLWLLGGTLPPPQELWPVAGVVVLAALASRPLAADPHPVIAVGIAVGLVLVVEGFTLVASPLAWVSFANGSALLAADSPALEALRARITAQDRFEAVGSHFRWGLTPKVASMTGLPSISDNEAQSSQRLAELQVQLYLDRPMQSLNDFLYRLNPFPKNRRIFDLLAARYLVVDPQAGPMPADLGASLHALGTIGDLALYENPRAFPRAYYVPTAIVELDPARRLKALAAGNLDLRRTVVLEEAPPPAAGGSHDARGDATIEADSGERVQIRVRADAPGFLVLSDQDYPGWSATVNGIPARVLTANHAFRAVTVPAGDSVVVWTYRPLRLWLGAAISLATLGAVVALLWRWRA
jgi:hypothetical protein